jgi:P27 family predicted phage terminase small subunit
MSDRPAAPRIPKDLSPAAATEWRRMVRLLAGKLHQLDEVALVVLCTSFADYREAQRQVDEHGTVVLGTTGQPIKNPYCLVLKESWERIRPLLAEFGLSPLARAKLKFDTESVDDGEIKV